MNLGIIMNALATVLALLLLVVVAVGGLVVGFVVLPYSTVGLLSLMVSAFAFPAILAIIENLT